MKKASESRLVKALSATPAPVVVTPAQAKFLEAVKEIRLSPDETEAAFIARQLVQCTLPHKNPGDVPFWTRSSMGSKLVITRSELDDETNELIGYPYGTIPRLLLFWITTEATRKKSKRLELGDSLAGFMRQLGLNSRNGTGKRSDARRLHDQARRLFASSIVMQETVKTPTGERGEHGRSMRVAEERMLWWDPKKPEQGTLWGSWIELSEKFYQTIISAPVPVDMRVLRALKRSPLALDLFVWCSYRAFVARQKRAPMVSSWEDLQTQFGAEYKDSKEFGRKARAALRKIVSVYPQLTMTIAEGAVIILPSSQPSISSR